MTTALHEDLRDFSLRLIDHVGGLVEWDAEASIGTAMVPHEVAQALRLPETFSLVTPPREGGLAMSLANDFLDQVGHLLEACVPRVAQFEIGDRYLKRGDLQQAVDDAFGWQNARVRVHEPRASVVNYHTWWFAASLRSDDLWEDRFAFTINPCSLAEVQFPDPLEFSDLRPAQNEGVAMPTDRAPRSASADKLDDATLTPAPMGLPLIDSSETDTLERAQGIAQRRLLHVAASFLDRIEAHRRRDQKRLRDYYHALLRETRAGSKRAKVIPTADERASKERAVDLELRRKLAELDERYGIQGILRPVVLVRTRVPTLAVELNVQRKQALRRHTVFWNSITKSFEPLACSRCHAAIVNIWFTNDTVDPLCRTCSE